MVRRARCCAGKVCIPATSWLGVVPGTRAGWLRWRRLGAASRDPQADRIARLEADKQRLERELAKARFVIGKDDTSDCGVLKELVGQFQTEEVYVPPGADR